MEQKGAIAPSLLTDNNDNNMEFKDAIALSLFNDNNTHELIAGANGSKSTIITY